MTPETAQQNTAKKPNIVFIFADEWRAQATGYAGDPNCHTPHLDRFAQESINFTNAASGCSVCCPYRGSLLSGQYPQKHGIFINDVELPKDTYSIARAFNDNGYQTGYIGKWHVYGSPGGAYERRTSYVPREFQMGFDYWKAFECSHDYNDSHYFFNDDPTRRQWEGYDAFAQSHDAAAYIKDHADEEAPFLLMLSLGPPHFPLHTAPEKYRQRYADKELILRENVPEEKRPLAQEELRGYYAHIEACDDAFKVVYDAIDEAGLREDTIFIFTADHGDMRQSQGLNTKLFPWDESVCVPFLMRWPQLSDMPPTENPLPIDAPDIMPTLLGLCNFETPESVQGRDWAPIIRGEEVLTGEEATFLNMTAEFTELCFTGMKAYRGLRTNRYTYVRNTDGPWLLYDNLEDPYQMNNLINQNHAEDIQNKLELQLQERLTELGDEFLDSRVYIERAGHTHFKEVFMECREQWHDPWKKSD